MKGKCALWSVENEKDTAQVLVLPFSSRYLRLFVVAVAAASDSAAVVGSKDFMAK